MLLLVIIACNIENHHLLVLDLLRCPCPPHSIHFKKLPQPPSLPDGIQNCPEQSPFEIVEEDGHTKDYGKSFLYQFRFFITGINAGIQS